MLERLAAVAFAVACCLTANALGQGSAAVRIEQALPDSLAMSGDTLVLGDMEGRGAARVYRWSGAGWNLEATLVASDGASGDRFGSQVAIDEDVIVVGADADDIGGNANQGSAYVFTRTGTTWTQRTKLVAPNDRIETAFGRVLAVAGDTIAVGSPTDGDGEGAVFTYVRDGNTWALDTALVASTRLPNEGLGRGIAISGDTLITAVNPFLPTTEPAVYVFRRSEGVWSQQARLTMPGAPRGFGNSICLSGDTAVVTTRDSNTLVAGQAYVFQRSGTQWTHEATLSDGSAQHSFGLTASLSGNTLIVGAYPDNGELPTWTHVFVRSGGSWDHQARIATPQQRARSWIVVAHQGDTAAIGCDDELWLYRRAGANWPGPEFKFVAADGLRNDLFGSAAGISAEVAAVGARNDDIGVVTPGRGTARLFQKIGGNWAGVGTLRAPDGASGDLFGATVAVSDESIVVGAPGDDTGAMSTHGSAYVFSRQDWGDVEAKLTAPDAAAFDTFGSSVAISGQTVLVGAQEDDEAGRNNQGAVYVFTRGASAWSLEAKLAASDAATGELFGSSLAIAGDTAVIGARGSGGPGAAYVFTRTGTIWTQRAKLTAPDGEPADRFGISVALDHDTIVVGASHDDIGANSDQGSAYVFVKSGSTWLYQAKLTAADGAARDEFGFTVGVSGDAVVVGAHLDDIGGNFDQGSLYAFGRAGSAWAEVAKLVVPDGAAGDRLGISACLFGGELLTGAQYHDIGSFPDQGAAYSTYVHGSELPVATNQTLGVGYAGLAPAIAAAGSGHQITATSGAFALSSAVDTSGLSLALRSTGAVRTPSTTPLRLTDGSSLEAAPGYPAEIYGPITLPEGAVVVCTANPLTLRGGSSLIAGAGATLELRDTSLDCVIRSNDRFDMREAELRVTGGDRTLEAMSTDIGAANEGLDRTLPGHYPLGTLRVGPAPSTVRLVDFHDNDARGVPHREAIYVETLRIDADCRLINDHCKVYYRSLVLEGVVDVPSNLIRLPGGCAADFNSDGQVDFFDYLDFVQAFSADDPAADFNGNGQVDFFDYLDFVRAFGAGC